MRAGDMIQYLKQAPNYDVLVSIDDTAYYELDVTIDESLQFVRIRIVAPWEAEGRDAPPK